MNSVRSSKQLENEAWLNRSLRKILISISIAAAFTIIVIVTVYARNFLPWELSSKNEAWGQFGDYIGGTLNPILSFFALISLLITLWVQSQSLDTARKQIAQQNNVASLSAQISAIGMLVESYTEQIQQLKDLMDSGGEQYLEAYQNKVARRKRLLDRLDDIYEKLVLVKAVA